MGSHRITSNHRVVKLAGAAFAAGALLLVGPAAAAFADPVSDAGGQLGSFGNALNKDLTGFGNGVNKDLTGFGNGVNKDLSVFGGGVDKDLGAISGGLANQTGKASNAFGQEVNGAVVKTVTDGNKSANIVVNNLNNNLRSILGFQTNGGSSR